MGLVYVGGVAGGRAGSTSTTTQSISGTLTGGIASSPSEGDLVIIKISAAGASGYTCSTLAVSSWTNGTFRSNTGATYYSYQQYSYKFMGSTPDTEITIPSSGATRNAQRWAVHVFRNVDTTTPLDVTTVYASGTASGRPNPGAITPATTGAWILWLGSSAAATGAAYTAPTDFATNWLGDTQSDNYDCMDGFGYYTGWSSGQYDPAAITAGGTTNAADTWVAETVVLRPSSNFSGSVSVTAVSNSVTATGGPGKSGSVSVTALSATLSAVGQKNAKQAASVTAVTATLTAAGGKNMGASAGTLSVSTSMSATGKKDTSGTISVSVTAEAITVTATKAGGNDKTGTASVSQGHTLTATVSKHISGTATVTQGSTLTAAWKKGGVADCTLSASTALSLTSRKAITGTATVSVSSTLTTSGMRTYYLKRYPNVILSASHLSGAYTDIDEDPTSPDGNWLLFAA